MTSSNGYYRHYLRDMLRVYSFYDQGKFESEEADELRDSMEEPWYNLTEEEQKRIRGLALDLNYNRAPKGSIELPPEAGRSILAKASELRDAGKFDTALELVRESQDGIFRPFLSFFRGRTWMEMNQNEVALEFFRDAYKQDEGDKFRLLDMFIQVLRMVDPPLANKEASKILVDPDRHPASRIAFAIEAKSAVIDENSSDAKERFERLLPILQRAVDRMVAGEETLPPVKSMTFALLADICEKAGQKDKAYDAMSELIKLEPDNPVLYALRGKLYFPEEKGILDYLMAINKGLRDAWPYIKLARHYLKNKKFDYALRVCEMALMHSMEPKIRRQLLDFLAIAMAGIGRHPREVQECFRIAIAANDKNERAKHNLAAYQEAVKLAYGDILSEELIEQPESQQPVVDRDDWDEPPEEYFTTIENKEVAKAKGDLVNHQAYMTMAV
jgi:tetratricopeptide (TPR) repeat protein